MKRHLPWILALAIAANTLPATASPDRAPSLDLDQFSEGDVVLRGEKVDGVCVYPTVSAKASAGAGPVLLRGTDDCEVVHAGAAPADAIRLCFESGELPEPIPTPPHACAGNEGTPEPDLSGGCTDAAGVSDCTKDPRPAAAALGDEGVGITAGHCPNRNLNSYISSGPTTVGVGMNYREHCGAGARVNSWYSYCSWNSGQGWRNRYFSYGGGWNYDVAWRWTECAFDHRHGRAYDAYHYMGTEVDGWNWYGDYCVYWWTWNPHTNYVVYSCWYS